MPKTPFERAVEKIGGQTKAASLLNVRRQSVSIALKRNPDRCPDGWALVLWEHSKVPLSKLRPDVYPPRARAAR